MHSLLGSENWNNLQKVLANRFPTYNAAVSRKRALEGNNIDASDDDDEDEGTEDDVNDSTTPLNISVTNPDAARNIFFKYYWSAHQRFFRSLCISLKVDSAVQLAKDALQNGNAVVIGLQSTGEAGIEYEYSLNEKTAATIDFVSAPAATLKRILFKLFPLPKAPAKYSNSIVDQRKRQRYEDSLVDSTSESSACNDGAPYVGTTDDDNDDDDDDDDNDEYIVRPTRSRGAGSSISVASNAIIDTNGNAIDLTSPSSSPKTQSVSRKSHAPIVTPSPTTELATPVTTEEIEYYAAYNLRKEYLHRISMLRLPGNPLDILIHELGVDNVAEMTGRKRRLVRDSSGLVTYVTRKDSNGSLFL